MAPRILVVDSNKESSAATEQLLASAGYDSASATSFEEASRTIATNCPDLLVTAVRLGRFNGLHLALRAHSDHPDLPIVIVGEAPDAALAADAARFGARFAPKPMDAGEFLGLVADMLDGHYQHQK